VPAEINWQLTAPPDTIFFTTVWAKIGDLGQQKPKCGIIKPSIDPLMHFPSSTYVVSISLPQPSRGASYYSIRLMQECLLEANYVVPDRNQVGGI
jgi:hypothetical protein